MACKKKQASDNIFRLGHMGAWPMTRKAHVCEVGALCAGLCQSPAAVWSAHCVAFPPHARIDQDGRL